jgi:MoaD family protein
MQVRFYANMQTITGREALAVSNHSGVNTLHDLFIYLAELFPNIRPQLFDENNNLRPDVPVFVNGRNPRLNGAIDAQLQSEDVISLFSPISSGKINVEVVREPAARKRV